MFHGIVIKDILSKYCVLQCYTCQLFLRYRREIFILGVLGFLKTITSEDSRRSPKKSEVFRRCPKSDEDEVIEKTLSHKDRC